MRRPVPTPSPVLAALFVGALGAAWWGCGTQTTIATSSSTGGGGASTTTTTGVGGVDFDGGSTVDDSGACTSTSKEAHPVPLDLLFLIDQSKSMSGLKWSATTAALTSFFSDPASAGISAGMVYSPHDIGCDCDFTSYEALDVPVAPLPANAFSLANSMPAEAGGACTPNYGALKGVLMAATAYQDAHPTHKVNVVWATDGEPWTHWGCDPVTVDAIAALAKSARNYNGVHTYVIGVEGSSLIQNLNLLAKEGGTTAAYDVTQDVSSFAAAMADIRTVALGCDFEIPKPPGGKELERDRVNFTYTPKGKGDPTVLLRAEDLADCAGKPGWYYDDNLAPTKIILCPASCSTVQADSSAKVEALFGCMSQVN